MALGRHRLGEGEDAAVRQQERVPGHPQHARRQRARTHRPGRPRNRRRRAHRTGGDRLPDLRGRRRRRSTSTASCATTSCAAARTSPTSRSTSCQARAQGPEPRHRQARPARAWPRSPPSTARASPWPKCRPARRCCRRWSRKSTARPRRAATRWRSKVIDIFKQHAGRGGRGLVYRGRPAQDAVRHRQGEGGAARHQRRDHLADAATSPSAASPWTCVHLPREKEDVDLVLRTAALGPHHAGGTARAARALRRRQCPARTRRDGRRRWCRCANW